MPIRKKKKENPARFSKIKDRKRKERNYKLYGILFLLGLFAGGLVYTARLPSLQISKVEVEGNSQVSAENIKSKVIQNLAGSYAFVIPRSNVFVVSQSQISAVLLSDFPQLEKVGLDASANTLTVNVVEREAIAIWCSESNDCYLIDSTGFKFSHANRYYFPDLIVFKGNIGGLDLGKFVDFKNKINTDIGLSILEVDISSSQQAQAHSTLGDIIFNPEDEMAGVVSNVVLLVKKLNIAKFEYIDARFGNKLFYKI